MKITVNESFNKNYKKYLAITKAMLYNFKNSDIQQVAEDILHDVYLMALYNEENIKCLDPMIYIINIIRIQIIAKNSQTTKNYFSSINFIHDLPDVMDEENYNDDDENYEKFNHKYNKIKNEIEQKISQIYWYNRELLDLYYDKCYSLRKIEKITNIPYTTVRIGIKKGERLANLTNDELIFLRKNREFIQKTKKNK